LRREDVSAPVVVNVYACGAGRLEVSLFAKQGLPSVTLSVNGLQPVTVPMPPNALLRGWIPAPPGGSRNRECVFNISPQGLIGMKAAVFDRTSTAAVTSAASREARGMTAFVPVGTVPLRRQENIAYCVGGAFQVRPAGRYPDATPASFVVGKGLTCDA